MPVYPGRAMLCSRCLCEDVGGWEHRAFPPVAVLVPTRYFVADTKSNSTNG